MSQIECKICPDGRLVLRDLHTFPDHTVRLLGSWIFWGAFLIACLSLALFVVIVGVSTSNDSRSFAPTLLAGLGWGLGVMISCSLLAVIGAVLLMKRPRQQCETCSATYDAH